MCEKLKAFYLFLLKKYIMAKGTQSSKEINDKNNNNKLSS